MNQETLAIEIKTGNVKQMVEIKEILIAQHREQSIILYWYILFSITAVYNHINLFIAFPCNYSFK